MRQSSDNPSEARENPNEVHSPASDPGARVGSGSPSTERCAGLTPKDRLNRVIRAFHGEVGSPLAAVAMRLEILRTGKRLDPASDELIEELSRELGDVVDSVRRSLKELRELESSLPERP